MRIRQTGIALALFLATLSSSPLVQAVPRQLAGHWAGAMMREGLALQVRFEFTADGSSGLFSSGAQRAC
jgi:hypothetical protein